MFHSHFAPFANAAKEYTPQVPPSLRLIPVWYDPPAPSVSTGKYRNEGFAADQIVAFS